MDSFRSIFEEFNIDTSSMKTLGEIMKQADNIIGAAEKLKAMKDGRIAALKKFGPAIFESDDNDLTVSLLRNDKEELIDYGKQFIVNVNYTDSASLIEKYNLTRPPHMNGFVYFLHAAPGYYASPEQFRRLKTFCTQISYEESLVLNKHFKEMKEKAKLKRDALRGLELKEEEADLGISHKEAEELTWQAEEDYRDEIERMEQAKIDYEEYKHFMQEQNCEDNK